MTVTFKQLNSKFAPLHHSNTSEKHFNMLNDKEKATTCPEDPIPSYS